MSRKAEFKVEQNMVIGLMDNDSFYEFDLIEFDKYFNDNTPGYEKYTANSDHTENKDTEVAFELIYKTQD